MAQRDQVRALEINTEEAPPGPPVLDLELMGWICASCAGHGPPGLHLAVPDILHDAAGLDLGSARAPVHFANPVL